AGGGRGGIAFPPLVLTAFRVGVRGGVEQVALAGDRAPALEIVLAARLAGELEESSLALVVAQSEKRRRRRQERPKRRAPVPPWREGLLLTHGLVPPGLDARLVAEEQDEIRLVLRAAGEGRAEVRPHGRQPLRVVAVGICQQHDAKAGSRGTCRME